MTPSGSSPLAEHPTAPISDATRCPYQLGAPIRLEDFLALPPDDIRYERDEEGRLQLMSPDRQGTHRKPLAQLLAWWHDQKEKGWWVLPEAAIAYPHMVDLDGRVLGESFLGPRAQVPDLAVFDREPLTLEGAPGGQDWLRLEGLRLVVQILSRKTQREDLGRVPKEASHHHHADGGGDRVDRLRSALGSGVPELWIVNLTPEIAIPAPGGLFLEPTEDRSAWRSLPVEGAEPIAEHAGLPVFAAGRARSAAVPGGELDVGALLAFLRGEDR